MKVAILLKIILVFKVILYLVYQINAGGGGGSRYVNTGSYSGPKRTNVSLYEPLIDHIFEGYNPLAIPICAEKKPLHLMVDMWLYQLFDLDEPKQELTLDVWIDLNWRDCSISWDPHEYNDIKQIIVPAHDIWHPDIFIYQGLHGNYEEGMFVFRESKVKIKHDGVIQLGAQLLLKTFCRVKIEKFPFDDQICPITFAAWNKDTKVFNMTMKPKHDDDTGHTFNSASNGEWTVLGLKASNSVQSFQVGKAETEMEYFSEVTFTLHLKRKPQFIQIYLMYPCILLIWVAAITFFLPVHSGEKVGLISTILLSLFVFLLIVSDNVPHTSDNIPLIAKFFFSCIGLVSLGMVFTVIVLNLSYRSSHIPMPIFFHKLLSSSVAQFLCFSFDKHHGDYMDCQVLFNNNPNNRPEIRFDGFPKRKEEKHWKHLGQLLDRVFMTIYLVLSLLLSLYICLAH